jgi:hypothetical protein
VKSSHKTEDLLVSLAESVGSTLGTLAAKAGAVQKALTHSDLASRVGRESKKIVRRRKRLVSGPKRAARKAPRRLVKRAVERTAKKIARKTRAAIRRSAVRARGAAARTAVKVRRSVRMRTRSRR